MQTLSLNPVLEGFSPIFKKLRAATFSALLIAPAVINVSIYSAENRPAQIRSVSNINLTNKDKQDFQQLAENALELTQSASSFVDFIIAMIPKLFDSIPLIDIITLENKIDEYDNLIRDLFVEMKHSKLEHPKLLEELQQLSQKTHYFCNAMKSREYKKQSDETVFPRVYQGEKSVGYRFNRDDSFEDFKKAMLS